FLVWDLSFLSIPLLYTQGTEDAEEVTFFTEEPLITKERQAVTTPFPSRTRSEGTSRSRRSGWAKPTTEDTMNQTPSWGSGRLARMRSSAISGTPSGTPAARKIGTRTASTRAGTSARGQRWMTRELP